MAAVSEAPVLTVEFTGAQVLRPDGPSHDPIAISDGVIVDSAARQVDLSGFTLLPGIVDTHGDGFERHVAPRRGAMKDVDAGLRAAEAEMAANGVTTGVMAQFVSWEGGLRGLDFADQVFRAIGATQTITDLRAQLRFEVNLLELYADLPEKIADWGVSYVVFNDHLPHDRLAEGRRPKQLTGQALKAGRNPDRHFELLLELHARSPEVPAALDALCPRLSAMGVRMGSHDDSKADARAQWARRGVAVTEFPETLDAAEAGDLVIMGAPNLVRGSSHKGNISALDVVLMGHCTALASDYHYPSLLRAALFLAKKIGLADAWALVSDGPARVLGLSDRGRLAPGLRADLVALDADHRIAGTISGGQFSFLRGDLAQRLLG